MIDTLSSDVESENSDFEIESGNVYHLEDLICKKQRTNLHLKQENLILQRFLQAVVPTDIERLSSVGLPSLRISPASSRRSLSPVGSARRSRSGHSDARQTLTWQEKHYIFFTELEKIEKEMESRRRHLETQLRTLQALIEGERTLTCELTKDIIILERHIKDAKSNPWTVDRITNNALQMLKNCVLQKKSLLERMKVKNIFLESRYQRLKQRFDKKEEVLLPVDGELLKLKLQSKQIQIRKRIMEINSLQQKHQLLLLQKSTLQDEISERKNRNIILDRKVDHYKRKLENLSYKIKDVWTSRRDASVYNWREAPDVLEHIRLKQDVARLEKSIQIWERRLKRKLL